LLLFHTLAKGPVEYCSSAE